MKATSDAVSSGALSEIHRVRAAPGLVGRVVGAVEALLARVASAITTALLCLIRVVAVLGIAVGSAFGVALTTGFGASVAASTQSLVRNITTSVTTTKAHAENRHHHHRAVRLRLSSGAGSAGQNGESDGRSEEHCEGCLEVAWMVEEVAYKRYGGTLVIEEQRHTFEVDKKITMLARDTNRCCSR